MLLNQDILGAAVCPFTSIPFFGPFFYMILLLALEGAIYIKTDNIVIPTIIGTVISGMSLYASVEVDPMFYAIAMVLIIFNVGVLIYGIYKGR